MRSLRIFALTLVGILALTSCQAAVEPEATITSAAPQVTVEPEPEPVYVAAPLTGVQYLEGENLYLSMPAVSAKIDNTFAGRPQLALNDADLSM